MPGTTFHVVKRTSREPAMQRMAPRHDRRAPAVPCIAPITNPSMGAIARNRALFIELFSLTRCSGSERFLIAPEASFPPVSATRGDMPWGDSCSIHVRFTHAPQPASMQRPANAAQRGTTHWIDCLIPPPRRQAPAAVLVLPVVWRVCFAWFTKFL